jgi:hypothetical protein
LKQLDEGLNVERPEHAPGDPAPAAGRYEQTNIFGRPNGIRVEMSHGHPFPQAPVGHFWRAVEADDEIALFEARSAGPATLPGPA